MIRRLSQIFSIASATLLTVAATASAQYFDQSPPEVHRTGRTYHTEVCDKSDLSASAACHAHVVTDAHGVRLTSASALPSGYGPKDLRAAYNITGLGSSSTTVAIVDAYGYPGAESDLAVYRSTYGLPACTTANGCFSKVNELGAKTSYPVTSVGWDEETALDLDMVSAMCPSCKILLVQANTASYADLGAAVNTAVRLGAKVVSNSYGGPEAGSAPYASAYQHNGVAIVVSSGDNGYGVQFPASSPYVTAVGGTTLKRSNLNYRGFVETAWSGAGSGCSAYYSQQAWQSPYAGNLCPKGRMVADVSAVADPQTPVAVYGPNGAGRSAWAMYGGTSVAAPLTGGVYGVNGGSPYYNRDPYVAGKSALNDVTSGANGNCGNFLCDASVGYDGPTGLGTPNGPTGF